MSSAEPLLRSVLFVPAANPRALAKSATLRVDALIFDLEDSAADGEKGEARERLRDHLKVAAPGALRIVRINPLASPHGTEDLLMARACGVDAILLPKVNGPDALAEASDALTETDAPLSLKLWAMIETPKGVREVEAISRARLRHHLGALVLGPNDLVAAAGLKISPGRPEFLPWLGPVLVAGRAAEVPVLDGVFNDLSDAQGFAGECAQARAFGFSGKTLIHPSQVEIADAAFAPSADEIIHAREIVAAFADPAAEGRGVIRLGSRMIERLHLAQAEALLARTDTIAARTKGPNAP